MRSEGLVAGRVEVVADVRVLLDAPRPDARVGVALGVDAALVAGPAEVPDRARVGHAVELLPVAATAVADPDVTGAGADREPDGVAQAVGEDAPLVGVRAAEQRVAGHARAGARIDPDQRAVEAGGVAGGAQVLHAQPAALGGRGGEHVADRAGRVAAGVRRGPGVAVVPECRGGAVATGEVEIAVGAEGEPAAGVDRVLLAPVLDQHLLRAGHRLAGDPQPRDATARDAVLVEAQGSPRAAVPRVARIAVQRRGAADPCIERVVDVDVGLRREVGVDGQRHQPAGGEVVHLGAQVRRHGRRRVREAGERLDDPALLGHEDLAGRRHVDVHRSVQAADRRRLLKARGQRHRAGGARRDERGQAGEDDREDSTEACDLANGHGPSLAGARRSGGIVANPAKLGEASKISLAASRRSRAQI